MAYRYFHISNGLRGCYMPDNAHIMAFKRRRDLISFVLNERADMLEAYGHGYSKRDAIAQASAAWLMATYHKNKPFNYAIGFGRSRSRSDRPFGLFICDATRADYLEYLRDCA
ncbi:MAG: hypothetical protein ACK5QX_04010 [bacterium]